MLSFSHEFYLGSSADPKGNMALNRDWKGDVNSSPLDMVIKDGQSQTRQGFEMLRNVIAGSAKVTSSMVEDFTKENLPPRDTTRWVARRKAEVVAAVNEQRLSVSEACNRYQLTLEELVSWQRAVDREGTAGLRATRVQQNRKDLGREARRA